MMNHAGHRERTDRPAVMDIGLVAMSGVALVNAAPDPALDIARSIGAEFPGGCPCLFVVDCERMSEAQLAFAMGWYLADDSRGRVPGSLVLFREVQFLSTANQTRFAQLLASRSRGDDAVRVVASTSVDLYLRVCEQRFDSTLFYLLNVVTVTPRRHHRAHARTASVRPDTEGDSTNGF